MATALRWFSAWLPFAGSAVRKLAFFGAAVCLLFVLGVTLTFLWATLTNADISGRVSETNSVIGVGGRPLYVKQRVQARRAKATVTTTSSNVDTSDDAVSALLNRIKETGDSIIPPTFRST